MKTVLGIKVSRRALAVAVVSGTELLFEDLRHVPIQPDRVEGAVQKYFSQLVEQFAPVTVALYTPATGEGMAQRVAQVIERQAREAEIELQRFNKADIFSGFGVVPVATRERLRERVAQLWPVVGTASDAQTTRRQVALAEAAAVALLGQLWTELPPPT